MKLCESCGRLVPKVTDIGVGADIRLVCDECLKESVTDESNPKAGRESRPRDSSESPDGASEDAEEDSRDTPGQVHQ